MSKVSLRYQSPRFPIVRLPVRRDFLMVASEISPVPPKQCTVKQAATVHGFLRAVSKVMGKSVTEIISPRRAKPLVLARQCVMILAKRHTGLSFPAIGYYVGGRDHSTIHHALKMYDETPAKFDPLISEILRHVEFPVETVENSIVATVTDRPCADNHAMVAA